MGLGDSREVKGTYETGSRGSPVFKLSPTMCPSAASSYNRVLGQLRSRDCTGRTDLKPNNRILHVQSSVYRQRFWDHEESVGESLHSELGSPLCCLLHLTRQVGVSSDLKGTGTGDERLVLESVLDGSETVSHGVGNLRDGVGVGAYARSV